MNEINDLWRLVELPLPRQVDDELAADIEKESVYVSPHLDRIDVAKDRATTLLTLKDPSKLAEVVDKAARFLAAMCKRRTGFAVNQILETRRRDPGPYEENAHQKLVERGWVHEYGRGHVAYSGPVLRLAQQVNEAAIGLYRTVFDVEEAHFPAFIDHETLQKSGYIESHPTTISFVANVVEDFDALESYRVANSCGCEPTMPPVEDLNHGGVCLNPAACLPAYPTLEGQVIGPEGRTISWLGRVFRYESRNVSGLDRLYEFNVREIVFVGTESFVAERREAAAPLIKDLAEMFDLDMSLQSATDPFFATVSSAKTFFQQAHDVKSEIMFRTLGPDGEAKQIAGGSINHHGRFFGERFDITTHSGEPAHSGCIGLGVERWVLAAFTQHGFDPRRWPKTLRDAIFD